jgi:hypothetical protein
MATVYSPHGEALGEHLISGAADLTDAWGEALIWADNDYREPYSMDCTVVMRSATDGRLMAFWLPEDSTMPPAGVPTL